MKFKNSLFILLLVAVLAAGFPKGAIAQTPNAAQYEGIVAQMEAIVDNLFSALGITDETEVSTPASKQVFTSSSVVAGDIGSFGLSDDGKNKKTPASGSYAYDTFGPGQAGFIEVGESFIDPIFGTKITRITDDYPVDYYGNYPYARSGYANADGTVTFSSQGVVNTRTGEVVDGDAPESGGWRQSFDPLDPDIYYYQDGSRLMQYDISRGRSSEVRNFGSSLGNLGGSLDWIDRTGRYFLLRIGGVVRIYDKQADELFSGSLEVPFVDDGGWVALSPDAKWIVMDGDFNHKAFPVDVSGKSISSSGHTFWTLCGGHGDVMTASNGKTYMITGSCWDHRRVYAVDVSIPQSASDRQKQRDDNILLLEFDWDQSAHYSSPSVGDNIDWAFVSTEHEGVGINDPDGSWDPYRNEIIAMNVVTKEVRRLAHHRSDVTSYATQPRVMSTWDGNGVIFASNFGATSGVENGYSDLYLIDLSDGNAQPPAPPATCSSFDYSDWGSCTSNNTQSRTVLSSSPSGCSGGTPITTQSCTYVPPEDESEEPVDDSEETEEEDATEEEDTENDEPVSEDEEPEADPVETNGDDDVSDSNDNDSTNDQGESFDYTFDDTDKASQGTKGKHVRWLQKALNRLGYTVAMLGEGSPGFETDYFGPATERALKKFQADNGIVSSGDPASTGYGALGPKTRDKLNNRLERKITKLSNKYGSDDEIRARIAVLLEKVAILQAILAQRIAERKNSQ